MERTMLFLFSDSFTFPENRFEFIKNSILWDLALV